MAGSEAVGFIQTSIEWAALGIEVVAVAVIVAGVVWVAIGRGTYRYVFHRGKPDAYESYKHQLGKPLLLGLDLLVAGDVVKTVALEPTIPNVAALGLLVLVRTFLSWSLTVEMEGRCRGKLGYKKPTKATQASRQQDLTNDQGGGTGRYRAFRNACVEVNGSPRQTIRPSNHVSSERMVALDRQCAYSSPASRWHAPYRRGRRRRATIQAARQAQEERRGVRGGVRQGRRKDGESYRYGSDAYGSYDRYAAIRPSVRCICRPTCPRPLRHYRYRCFLKHPPSKKPAKALNDFSDAPPIQKAGTNDLPHSWRSGCGCLAWRRTRKEWSAGQPIARRRPCARLPGRTFARRFQGWETGKEVCFCWPLSRPHNSRPSGPPARRPPRQPRRLSRRAPRRASST